MLKNSILLQSVSTLLSPIVAAGTVMTFIQEKRSVDYMIEKLNISNISNSRRMVKHQPLRIRLFQLDTILSGIIFKFQQPGVLIFIVEFKIYTFRQTLIGLFIISFFLFTIVLIRFQSFALAFKSCCILSNRHF